MSGTRDTLQQSAEECFDGYQTITSYALHRNTLCGSRYGCLRKLYIISASSSHGYNARDTPAPRALLHADDRSHSSCAEQLLKVAELQGYSAERIAGGAISGESTEDHNAHARFAPTSSSIVTVGCSSFAPPSFCTLSLISCISRHRTSSVILATKPTRNIGAFFQRDRLRQQLHQ